MIIDLALRRNTALFSTAEERFLSLDHNSHVSNWLSSIRDSEIQFVTAARFLQSETRIFVPRSCLSEENPRLVKTPPVDWSTSCCAHIPEQLCASGLT
ncbi:hypothetical protein EYF80_004594 [Liparis tanakae]|uniref:Uncharacterized protein n=1 Tax=Liparis tanakae TaxID=230148 RepID=A0A4Z2J5U9_9TELE|nr:hypothetical protein EYF80_004594 [Liparis tanakae]